MKQHQKNNSIKPGKTKVKKTCWHITTLAPALPQVASIWHLRSRAAPSCRLLAEPAQGRAWQGNCFPQVSKWQDTLSQRPWEGTSHREHSCPLPSAPHLSWPGEVAAHAALPTPRSSLLACTLFTWYPNAREEQQENQPQFYFVKFKIRN